jgi:hypothetical protein
VTVVSGAPSDLNQLRARQWAAIAAEGAAADRQAAAEMSMSERLAEGVRMVRLAESLQASMRRAQP